MAKIRSGVLGNTRGKVSGVVGSQWKDVNYLREYVQPANPNTAAQQAQRSKMADCVAFCKHLVGPVFNAYTDRFHKSMSGFNFFIKENIAEFVEAPVYANLKLTSGKLYFGGITSCTWTLPSGNVTIGFSIAHGNNGASSDKVFAACYDTSTGFWYFAEIEVNRSVGEIMVPLAETSAPGNIEAYCWVAKYSNTLVSMLSDSDHQQAVAP